MYKSRHIHLEPKNLEETFIMCVQFWSCMIASNDYKATHVVWSDTKEYQ